MTDWYADIEEAIAALKDCAPKLARDVPQLAPFLGMFGVQLHAVRGLTNQGMSVPDAVNTVASQVTAGQPNSATLSASAPIDTTAGNPDMPSVIASAVAAAAAVSPDVAASASNAALAGIPAGNGASVGS